MNTKTLPDGYYVAGHVDLTTNKKLFIGLNVSNVVIVVIMVVLGLMMHTLSIAGSPLLILAKFAALMGGIFLYMILHELVHGLFIRVFSGERPFYGYTRGCAFAGSYYFYNRKSYIVIALAPIIIWGILLAIICAIVPANWFWAFYAIQILNISGAVGDLYITWFVLKRKPDVLVKDDGASMTFYER